MLDSKAGNDLLLSTHCPSELFVLGFYGGTQWKAASYDDYISIYGQDLSSGALSLPTKCPKFSLWPLWLEGQVKDPPVSKSLVSGLQKTVQDILIHILTLHKTYMNEEVKDI